jgi:hypothetical protein
MERKKAGKMAESKKPALHEAPLDAVPGNTMLDAEQIAEEALLGDLKPNPGVRVESPDLTRAKVQGVDFASSDS